MNAQMHCDGFSDDSYSACTLRAGGDLAILRN